MIHWSCYCTRPSRLHHMEAEGMVFWKRIHIFDFKFHVLLASRSGASRGSLPCLPALRIKKTKPQGQDRSRDPSSAAPNQSHSDVTLCLGDPNCKDASLFGTEGRQMETDSPNKPRAPEPGTDARIQQRYGELLRSCRALGFDERRRHGRV